MCHILLQRDQNEVHCVSRSGLWTEYADGEKEQRPKEAVDSNVTGPTRGASSSPAGPGAVEVSLPNFGDMCHQNPSSPYGSAMIQVTRAFRIARLDHKPGSYKPVGSRWTSRMILFIELISQLSCNERRKDRI